jgi:ABC-type phosphate transport system substrate-binding protein
MKKRNIKSISIIIIFLLIFCYTPFAADSGITIIVNKEVRSETLSKNDIKGIFLGNKKTWDNNLVIVPVLSKTESIHKIFLKQFIKRSARQFKNVWKKNLFLGKAKMPKSFSDEKQLIKFISETSGAIGYITSDFQTDEIKVITVN